VVTIVRQEKENKGSKDVEYIEFTQPGGDTGFTVQTSISNIIGIQVTAKAGTIVNQLLVADKTATEGEVTVVSDDGVDGYLEVTGDR